MGIYIKGMEMPNCCEQCFLVSECKCRHYEVLTVDGAYIIKFVKDDCPLTEVAEPHGRLIDAEILMGALREDIMGGLNYQRYIEDAPTVIERSNKTSIDVGQLSFDTPITMTESLADMSPMEWSKDVLSGEKKVEVKADNKDKGTWLTEYTEEEVEKEFPNIAKYNTSQAKTKCIAQIKIDRDDLENLVNEKVNEIVDKMVEPKTGKWIKATGMMPPEFHGHHCCSECGNFANMEPPFGNREDLSKYCPNCGARMLRKDGEA